MKISLKNLRVHLGNTLRGKVPVEILDRNAVLGVFLPGETLSTLNYASEVGNAFGKQSADSVIEILTEPTKDQAITQDKVSAAKALLKEIEAKVYDKPQNEVYDIGVDLELCEKCKKPQPDCVLSWNELLGEEQPLCGLCRRVRK